MFRIFPEAETHTEEKLIFGKYTYAQEHWANHVPTVEDDFHIAVLEIASIQIALTLSPDDSRGYRTIARLIDPQNMYSTFNRQYTISEKLALYTAVSALSSVYESYQISVQVQLNGNNSQCVTNNGMMQVGVAKEPSILHAHIIGRGNPNHCYVGNVPLRGPNIGVAFDGRGKNAQEEGNTKRAWDRAELKIVAASLARRLIQVIRQSPELQEVNIISVNCDQVLMNKRHPTV